jgi:hypothetical protein
MKDICPICSSTLLRHLHQHEIAWFCPQCRQEMPNLNFDRGNTIPRNLIPQKSDQYQHKLTHTRQKPKIVAEQSIIIDSFLHESQKRMEIVSFILSQTNSIILNTNLETHDNALKRKNNYNKLRLANFFRESEIILLYICQAILARDINILNQRLCQRLKANYTQLNLPTELIVSWLELIKTSVVDFIGSTTMDLSNSLPHQNYHYSTSEIASYFEVVIASII